MKKIILSSFLALMGMAANSQITPPITIPDTIPNYDGTYDHFGFNHLYYPNGGEIRFADEFERDALDVVEYYTMNTYPKKFLLRNKNLSLLYSKPNATTQTIDSLHRIDAVWKGSNGSAFLTPADTQSLAKLNYLTQWFGTNGRTDVMGSAAIVSQSIYNNTDLVYLSNNAGIVIYFIVYPGGDFNNIVMHLDGSKSNSIIGNKLKIDANWESTTFEKPRMYQYVINNNVITPVNVCNATWQSLGGNDYKINNATAYNPALPLIIQIKQANAVQASSSATGLKWSTYFGGGQFEFLNKTKCDASDNLYIAGYSNSTSQFPQAPGVTPFTNNGGDGVIAKFNSTGKLLWSAFVGGSSRDEIHDFDFNGNNITCVGKTASTNMVAVNKSGATNNGSHGGGSWDGFIFEFGFSSNAFQNYWRTYYGGNGEDELNGCLFDGSGNLFVVGASSSGNLTSTGPSGSYIQSYNASQFSPNVVLLATDAIIGKFNTSSLQTWFTFYGTDALGANANYYPADYFYGIAIDGSNVYACGKAGGSNLPSSVNSKMNANNFDGILVNFNTACSLGAAKYTDGNIANYAVKVHQTDVYTVGEANAAMSPANSGLYYYTAAVSGTADACFSVHSQNLTSTIHNSFLGGSGDDAAYDIQFTPNNYFLIAGGTNSNDFPTNNFSGAYYSTAQALNDNFISCFQKNNTNLIWSTYLGSNDAFESLQYSGGINFQYETAATSIAVNGQSVIHVLGTTNSYNAFPIDPWTGPPVYYQPTLSGTGVNDATVTRLDGFAIGSVVGMKDFENTNFLLGICPNPAINTIAIKHAALVNENLRYAIYDLNGKKLKTGNLKAEEVKSVDVSFLPQGIYVMNVSNGKVTFSNKFVKADN